MKSESVRLVGIVLLVFALLQTGCKTKSHAGEEAKKGAAYGALGGAVSGFFWGLFTGNPVERAAQGAVVGGATGGTLGAVHGSSKDRDLKAEYGETNYKGLMALVERNYPLAKEYAARTAEDANEKYRHASAWLSVLIAKETLAAEEMDPYYEKLIEYDPDVSTIEDAKVEVRLAERDLKSLRKQLNSK
jgi:predicted small secreted protein